MDVRTTEQSVERGGIYLLVLSRLHPVLMGVLTPVNILGVGISRACAVHFTHMRVLTRTHTRTCESSHTHTCTCESAHTHTHMCERTRAHTHTRYHPSEALTGARRRGVSIRIRINIRRWHRAVYEMQEVQEARELNMGKSEADCK